MNSSFKVIRNGGKLKSAQGFNRGLSSSLVVEKDKPSEIYKRMCDVFEEHVLNKCLSMGVPQRALIEKKVHGKKFFGKNKFQVQC